MGFDFVRTLIHGVLLRSIRGACALVARAALLFFLGDSQRFSQALVVGWVNWFPFGISCSLCGCIVACWLSVVCCNWWFVVNDYDGGLLLVQPV